MSTATDVIKKVDELSELALKEDGYPYVAGYLKATLVSMIISHVPKENWNSAVAELQNSIDYFNEVQKK